MAGDYPKLWLSESPATIELTGSGALGHFTSGAGQALFAIDLFERTGDADPGVYHVMASTWDGTVIGITNWAGLGTGGDPATPFFVDVGTGENYTYGWDSVAEANLNRISWVRGWYSGVLTETGSGAGNWWTYSNAPSEYSLAQLLDSAPQNGITLTSGAGEQILHTFNWSETSTPRSGWTRPITYQDGSMPESSITWNTVPEFMGPSTAVNYTDDQAWIFARQFADFDVQLDTTADVYLYPIFTDSRTGTAEYTGGGTWSKGVVQDSGVANFWSATDGTGQITMRKGPWMHRPVVASYFAYSQLVGFNIRASSAGGTRLATYTVGDPVAPPDLDAGYVIRARPSIQVRAALRNTVDGGAP